METTPLDYYTADSNPDLMNPERGMYSGSTPNTTEEFHTIVHKWLWLRPWCNKDLVWDKDNPDNRSPVLKDYVHGTPAVPGIRRAVPGLEDARKDGYKVLFRPRYDRTDIIDNPDYKFGDEYGPSDCTFEGENDKVFHADSMARQKIHITAIANMLESYRDVIAYIQAGYLGVWGEWNYFGYTSANAPLLADIALRKEVIDWVIHEYDRVGIMQHVELRRPVFAKEVVERNPSAKVGLHNDCFMTTTDDMGTYCNFDDCDQSDDDCPDFAIVVDDDGDDDCGSAEAKAWAQSFTENASFGGETCPAGSTDRWSSCTNMTGASSEPASLHMNYLNQDFFKGAIDKWKKDGCYDEIRRRLGYRFEVRRVEYTKDVRAGGTFRVTFDVANTGWARLHKPRDAWLVLRNVDPRPGLGRVFSWLGGPRKFLCGPVWNWAPGTTTKISVSGSTLSFWPGTYSVRLWIPDPDLLEFLSTSPNPDDYQKAKTNYAVKLATKRNDANVFDPNTAENDLGVEITVRPRPPWDRVPPWLGGPQDAARR